MITSSHSNQFSYIKRLFTLAIIVSTIFIIACTSKKNEELAKPIEIQVIEYGNRTNLRNLKTLNLPEGTLIYLDGKEITSAQMRELNPDLIEYDVMLDEQSASEKYGNKAAKGAYELYSIEMVSASIKEGKEHLPSFPGGRNEWNEYLTKKLNYPQVAIDKGTMGITKIAFTVKPDGFIKDVKIVEDPGDGLGEESMRLIKKGPKWVPGKVKGEAVEQRVIQTITYRLE